MSQIWLMIFSLIGLILSTYLWKKKSKKEKLVCIIGKDCSKVINSKYGEALGIDNILMGALFYIFIFLIGMISIILPLFLSNLVNLAMLLSSSLALLMSIYLSSIQIFKLKELCEYCLASALINLILFLIIIF